MRRIWVHVVLVLVGLAAVVWALTLGADPVIVCRDAVMRPGDVCANAVGTRTQTYEERWRTAQQARPVVGGVGLVAAGFGAVLAWGELRRRDASTASADPTDLAA